MLVVCVILHVIFVLTIHVNGKILSNKQKEVEFCRLLSGMLEDVPTEDGPMRVLWARVKRMLEAYRKSVDTAKKNRKFDANWSPGSNPGLRLQLQDPFPINPPQVLVIRNEFTSKTTTLSPL